MKPICLFFAFATLLLSACQIKQAETSPKIEGTWKLLTGTTITRGVSAVTDYTKNQQMIKIINADHFAFLKHPVAGMADTTNKFDAGGGKYTLAGNQYTEYLDFYNDRNWEGKSFNFTIHFDGDTLIQKGIEKVEKENIDRIIIEKYIRVK